MDIIARTKVIKLRKKGLKNFLYHKGCIEDFYKFLAISKLLVICVEKF